MILVNGILTKHEKFLKIYKVLKNENRDQSIIKYANYIKQKYYEFR